MARPTPLYGKEVNRPRALMLWMMLALAAGSTNVLAYIACARFVTHVTGIATLVGQDIAELTHALDYSLVLAAFVAGAASSEFVLGSDPIRRGMARALALVASMLALVATAGALDWFDAFGEGLEDPLTFLFLGALAFAMGLQNAAIATATGGRVRTTHMTGPATDLGVALARMTSKSRKERVAARQLATLRAVKLFGFIAGAVLGGIVATWQYLALLVPAALCLSVAFIIRFVPNALLTPAPALKLPRRPLRSLQGEPVAQPAPIPRSPH